MNLAELQAAFQAGVLASEEPEATAILSSIRDSQRTDRATLFGVYVNAYRLRLAEFISKDYPVLREILGEEEFEDLARAYIEGVHSSQPNARWYASRLPKFMSSHCRWRTRNGWIDLARFERALGDAFDAADAPVLDMSAFSSIPPAQVPRLCFELHPSVRLLELTAGTTDVYAAAAEGKGKKTAVPGQGRKHVLFWRQEEQSFYRPLAEDEAMALNEVRDAHGFGDICSTLAFCNIEEDVTKKAASFLLRWFDDGLVSAIGCRE
jgi:hypothetical protein